MRFLGKDGVIPSLSEWELSGAFWTRRSWSCSTAGAASQPFYSEMWLFCKVCVAKGPFQMRQQTMSLGIRPLMFLACAALRADVFTSFSGRSFGVKVLVP